MTAPSLSPTPLLVLRQQLCSRACTSSKCLPSCGASLPNTTMNLIHMSDSFLQDAIYNKIFKTIDASYAHVYLKKINNNKCLISKPNTYLYNISQLRSGQPRFRSYHLLGCSMEALVYGLSTSSSAHHYSGSCLPGTIID